MPKRLPSTNMHNIFENQSPDEISVDLTDSEDFTTQRNCKDGRIHHD